MASNSGVYAIQNKLNGKLYIGSTDNIKRRWYDHKCCLTNNSHYNRHLQSSWNVHGKNIFEFVIIEEVSDKSKLFKREQYWMDKFESYKITEGYNLCKTAGSQLGSIRNKKVRKTISLSITCSPKRMEQVRNLGLSQRGKKHPNFGKPRSTEVRNKISKGHMGLVVPKEVRKKDIYSNVWKKSSYVWEVWKR